MNYNIIKQYIFLQCLSRDSLIKLEHGFGCYYSIAFPCTKIYSMVLVCLRMRITALECRAVPLRVLGVDSEMAVERVHYILRRFCEQLPLPFWSLVLSLLAFAFSVIIFGWCCVKYDLCVHCATDLTYECFLESLTPRHLLSSLSLLKVKAAVTFSVTEKMNVQYGGERSPWRWAVLGAVDYLLLSDSWKQCSTAATNAWIDFNDI